MKDRPTLFSAPMIKALLADTKTQTRRICKGARELSRAADWPLSTCPYGVPGDRLWVRETFALRQDLEPGSEKSKHYVRYRADADDLASEWHNYGGRWKPSIFMPRWASRLALEVTEVRVERLLDISEADAIAEGIELVHGGGFPLGYCWPGGPLVERARLAYLSGWDTINAKRAPAASNPWVWCVTFKRLR